MTKKKLMNVVADLSLAVVKVNVNSGCMFIAHQPKLPKGADRFRNDAQKVFK